MKAIIQWTNKMSGEQGYVKSVSKAYGNFINTWNSDEAKVYRSDTMVEKDIKILDQIGETVNNYFTTITIA